jgi:hypothetical protein
MKATTNPVSYRLLMNGETLLGSRSQIECNDYLTKYYPQAKISHTKPAGPHIELEVRPFGKEITIYYWKL